MLLTATYILYPVWTTTCWTPYNCHGPKGLLVSAQPQGSPALPRTWTRWQPQGHQPCPNEASAVLDSSSTKPCPSWPWNLTSWAQPWPNTPVLACPYPQSTPVPGAGLPPRAPSCTAPDWGNGAGTWWQALPRHPRHTPTIFPVLQLT